MRGLAITNKGSECIASLEIRELLGCTTDVGDQCITFDVPSYHELYRLAYHAQSLTRVLRCMDSFSFTKLEQELPQRLNTLDFSFIKEPFTVTGLRIGEHDFSAKDIVPLIATSLKPRTFTYKTAKTVLFYFITGTTCYFGEDVAGRDLSKRSYKIFPNRFSLKGTTAYTLVRLSGYTPGQKLVDPLCRDGTIVIEAALYAKRQSPHFFDKRSFLFIDSFVFNDSLDTVSVSPLGMDGLFPNISASKKNAQIAGVDRDVRFRRASLDDLDIAFGQPEIDVIVTSAPLHTRLAMLFAGATYALKDSGKIALLAHEDVTSVAQEHGFSVAQQFPLFLGSSPATVFLLEKTQKSGVTI